MAKKVLVVLSGHEYWGEELIGALEALDARKLTADSYTTGRKLVEVPENGLRRYGW
jgi:hypothetical protein